MEKFKNYFIQSKIELNKVIFPTKGQVRMAFISVAVVVFVIALFLAFIDLIMSFSISAIV